MEQTNGGNIISGYQLAEVINDASIDRILAVDTEMRVITWNKSCETVTGISKANIIGRDLLSFFPELSDNQNIKRAFNGALHGHRMFLPPEKGSCLGGYHESHFIPLKSEGTIIGMLCLMHDVAHRVKTENELKSLNRSLVKKNKELKDKNAEVMAFSQVTGEDLKEPLRKIYMFSEMIRTNDSDKLSEEGQLNFKRIQASIQRIGLLSDDLLDYSQVGMVDRKSIALVNLNHVVKMAQYNMAELIEQKQPTIYCAQLPVVLGYRPQLTVLFQKLLHNALKFHKKDRVPDITITSSVVSGKEIGDSDAIPDIEYTKISIGDNGIGFDTKYKERIFKIFEQLNKGPLYSGSGIGLPICRKIMQLHDGFITAESDDAGSVFHCYFPLRDNS